MVGAVVGKGVGDVVVGFGDTVGFGASVGTGVGGKVGDVGPRVGTCDSDRRLDTTAPAIAG